MLRVGIEGPHSPSRYILQCSLRPYVCHPRNAYCYSFIATIPPVDVRFDASIRRVHKARHFSGSKVASISDATKRTPHSPSELLFPSVSLPVDDVESTHQTQELLVQPHPLHVPPPDTTFGLGSRTLHELKHGSSVQTAIGSDNGAKNRDELLKTIIGAKSIYQAWDGYSTLLSMQKRSIGIPPDGPIIPVYHLHHLAKLLSQTKPRTREVFLRLLSVLTTLRTSGGKVYTWEWNTLVHCAGKGWRKTTVEDYRTALGVFKDMVGSGQMSPSFNAFEGEGYDETTKSLTPEHHVRPDIITFTTLIDIAARTNDESTLRHATSLLDASRIPWNSKTHRAMIPYYIRTNQLHAIPGILAASITERLDIRAVNNCMWAFASKGRLRVALQVYDHLRRNIPHEHRLDINTDSGMYPAAHDGHADFEEQNPILATPGFTENATMPPDIVTYTLLTQALCYRGDLRGALTIFRDMITTIYRPSSTVDPNTPICYKPTSAIYRAIFLGFVRHANEKRPAFSDTLLDGRHGIDEVPLPEFAARLTSSTLITLKTGPIPKRLTLDNPWTLANLEAIFDRFLELDWDEHAVIGEPAKMPSDRLIYWIMVAYAKCTNQDVRKMYTIWKRLDRRFQLGVFGKKLSKRLKLLGRELERRQVQ